MGTRLLPSLYPTYFAIIIIIFCLTTIPISGGSNANYTVCSSSNYSCGSIKNIGYPFWGGDRPQFCGYPDFHLTCFNDNSSHMYIPSLNYAQVLNISTSSHKIFVLAPNKSNFLQGSRVLCQPQGNIKPYVSRIFKFSSDVVNLTLFYGCNHSVLKYGPKYFGCLRDDYRNGTLLYFPKMSDMIKEETKSCKNYSVPVPKTELDKLYKGSEKSLHDVLQKGVIEVEYVLNFTVCSACQTSGGTCGSSGSPSSSGFVCYYPHGHREKPLFELILVVLGIISGALLVLITIMIFCYKKKLIFNRRKSVPMSASMDRSTSDIEISTIYFGVPIFSYIELKEATDNFHESKELGDGGFGTVYYGKLKDGREVAVKRLYEKSCRRVEQFMNEVRILTTLKHPNLVSLYGCTSSHCNELLLVYEYIPNGTVADHLFGDKANTSGFLPWNIRMNIAIETATALAYLHASDIIHRDVKTNNILLDNDFHVKVADFGLSRLFPNDATHVSTAPQGTPGYLDPEYHQCYQLTDKSDVYSFGVVLVELISSLPAVDMDRHKQEINLSNYAMSRIQRCAFDELVDPELGFLSDFKVRRMTTLVAELAFQCLQHDREFRPAMDEVLESLRRIQSADYDELKAQEDAKNEGLNVKYTIDAPSPTEKDDAMLLRDHQHRPPSPDSVMDKWASKFTTPNTSN